MAERNYGALVSDGENETVVNVGEEESNSDIKLPGYIKAFWIV